MLPPFEVLYDAAPPTLGANLGRKLTGTVAETFGGPLPPVSGEVVFANFVTSLDGVAVLDAPSAGSVISGRNEADRFMMALLRASADAVLIGGATLRATPGHRWTAEHVYPPLASEWADMRRQAGHLTRPRLVVLTASGDLDTGHPGLADDALVITTEAGATRLAGNLPGTCEVRVLAPAGSLPIAEVVDSLRADGLHAILSEAGPEVTAQLVDQRLLGELFLTLAPVLAGRAAGGSQVDRAGLTRGVEFLPGRRDELRLLSVRRHEEFIFLRYALDQ